MSALAGAYQIDRTDRLAIPFPSGFDFTYGTAHGCAVTFAFGVAEQRSHPECDGCAEPDCCAYREP